jgi:hypothetical protein
LGFRYVDLLGTSFFALHPLSGKSSEIRQLALCCYANLLTVFNFPMSFDFGCCSLAQEMSFVDHYLPYFMQQLITSSLLALLSFQSLFTESSRGDQLLVLPPSPVHSEHSAPSAACSFSVPCLLFRFFCFVFCFCRARVRLSRRLCWFIPGVAVGISHAAYLLTYWSASPMQVWRQHLAAWEPSCFLSVTWHGEDLYGLEVQGVKVLILLGGFFFQVWLQHLSKIFDLQSSCCLLLPSSHHLGYSRLLFFLYKT